MSSCLEAIETSITDEVKLVPGVAYAAAVPLANLFKTDKDGTVILDHSYLPRAYPGELISLNDDEIDFLPDESQQVNGTAGTWYGVPVYITVLATSDGTDAAAARRKAWEISEATNCRLDIFTPTGLSAGARANVVEPGPMTALVIDGNTHGVVIRRYVRYYIETGI